MTFTGGSGAAFESSPQDPSVQTFSGEECCSWQSTGLFGFPARVSFSRDDQNGQGGGQPGDGSSPQAGAPTTGPGGGLASLSIRPIRLRSTDGGSLAACVVAGGCGGVSAAQPPTPLAGAGGTSDTSSTASAGTSPAHSVSSLAGTSPAAKNAALAECASKRRCSLWRAKKISGTLAPAEYAEQKAALETVLKRALKKKS